jgi:hypothetical protein
MSYADKISTGRCIRKIDREDLETAGDTPGKLRYDPPRLPAMMLALVAGAMRNPQTAPLIPGAFSGIGAAIFLFSVDILIKGKCRRSGD